MTHRLAALALLALSLVYGCSASLDRNPSERCDAMGACSAGRTCVRGFCLQRDADASVPCPGAETRCDDRCTSLDSDDAHCGSCEIACGDHERCHHGVCEAR